MVDLKKQIFKVRSVSEFNDLALEIFHYQYSNNEIYREFVNIQNINIHKIEHFSNIPFLPIGFFKSHKIITGNNKPEITFFSSGTALSGQSKHAVTDVNIYKESFRKSFEHFYGDIREYCIFALLPSYLERDGSSLIYMINDLINLSGNEGGFYLEDNDILYNKLTSASANNKKILLFGVSFALLDMAEKYDLDINDIIIMETGGMKGRRKELIRIELHSILCQGFHVSEIHSEYGMTELLSQAYSKGKGIFNSPPWMKVLIRDINDPVTIVNYNQTGGINVIDLANIESCSFIATQDLGKTSEEGSFEVLGRFDNSDIRGCNLLVE